jgi:hypothetical protein
MKTIKKFIGGPLLTSYWFTEYSSGIKHLMVNTVNKWIFFDKLDNNKYMFAPDDTDIVDNSMILDISEIPEMKDHLCIDTQNKDQVSFYWIPLDMVSSGKLRETFLNRKDK